MFSIDIAVYSIIVATVIAEWNNKKLHRLTSYYIVIRRATPLPQTKKLQLAEQSDVQTGI